MEKCPLEQEMGPWSCLIPILEQPQLCCFSKWLPSRKEQSCEEEPAPKVEFYLKMVNLGDFPKVWSGNVLSSCRGGAVPALAGGSSVTCAGCVHTLQHGEGPRDPPKTLIAHVSN